MWWLLTIGIIFYTFRFLRQRKITGGIPFVHRDCLDASSLPLFARLFSLVLYVASFVFLTLALVHEIVGEGPLGIFLQKEVQATIPQKSSRLVSFVVDQSGSMAEPMPGDKDHSKMYVVQQALQQSITDLDSSGKGTDLISLISFARAARVIVPFSRDRTLLRTSLFSLVPETKEFLNGTAIGYAIFKGVRLILACKAFASETFQKDVFSRRSMIVITDGIEEPHPGDRNHPFRSMGLEQAIENAAQSHVAIYYVNIDRNSYRLMTLEEREKIASAVRQTGGKYFEVTAGASLRQILQEVVEQEKVQIPFSRENQLSLGFWLVVFSMVSLAASRLFETAFMRVAQ